MTGRDVQSGGRRDFRKFGFAAGIRHDVEDKEGTVKRLDAAMVPPHRRPRRHDASPLIRSFGRHGCSLPGSLCFLH
jgi:hypothetical protein